MKKKLIYIGIFASLLVLVQKVWRLKRLVKPRNILKNVPLHTSMTPGLTLLHLIKPRKCIRTISLFEKQGG